MKTILYTTVLLMAVISSVFGQQITTVDSNDESIAVEDGFKKLLRNPFAASDGVTNKNSRLVREALSSTKILSIIHMDTGKKMAVLSITGQENPVFVNIGSKFSIEISGNEWSDVQVVDISKFEVKVTPKGVETKIIIR